MFDNKLRAVVSSEKLGAQMRQLSKKLNVSEIAGTKTASDFNSVYAVVVGKTKAGTAEYMIQRANVKTGE